MAVDVSKVEKDAKAELEAEALRVELALEDAEGKPDVLSVP